MYKLVVARTFQIWKLTKKDSSDDLHVICRLLKESAVPSALPRASEVAYNKGRTNDTFDRILYDHPFGSWANMSQLS